MKLVFLLCCLFCFAIRAEAKSTLAYTHYTHGVELAARKNYSEAAVQFRQAIDLNPNYIAAYIECARSLVMLGKRKDGLTVLSSAVKVTKHKEELEHLAKERASLSQIFYTNGTFQQYQNGLNYLRLDRANSAQESFEKAYVVEPDNVLILLGYSQALEAEDNQKLRIEFLEKAYELDDSNRDTRVQLADAVLAKNPERAMALVKNLVLARNPTEEAALLYTRALSALKRDKEAIDVLTDCREKNSDWVLADFWLGKFNAAVPGGNWAARKYLMTFQKRADSLLHSAGEDGAEKLAPSVRSLKSLKIEADALLTQVNKALE